MNSNTSDVTLDYEEPIIKYIDEELESNNMNDDDGDSITSEEESQFDILNDNGIIRIKSTQEIFDDTSIWDTLMTTKDFAEIRELIMNENYQKLIKHDSANTTGILVASWLGNEKALKALLDAGYSPNVTDENGRSALHLATCCGSEECVKLLVDRGGLISKWDNNHKATPLHCAASRGHINCLKHLIKVGAEINAGIQLRSPLHYAVQSLAGDCVKALLEAGAIPNTPQIFTETPLHVAASLGSAEIIKILLEHGSAVRVQCGPDKSTALHLAAEDGNAESARLLLNAGACANATNNKLQTPLHLAALSQSTETLELLIKHGADPNARDISGRTPLHAAIGKVSRSSECVRLLISAGANVNQADAFGYTPLHLAALNEFSQCVLLLINSGGDVTLRTNGGISVLTFITRRTPEVIPKYIEKFDASIKLNDHELGDVDCELKLDFRVLVPSVTKGESELLLSFIEVGHKEVLKHPLCETFLFLKWRRIRKFFFFSLFYHCVFALLFTQYIVGVFLRPCEPLRRIFSDPCSVKSYVTGIGYVLIMLNLMLTVKEIFQFAHGWKTYIKQWENWLQWLIIISVCCSVYPTDNMNIRVDVSEWQHHVAAVGIFLTWLELMMIVGRFPIFGLYVQMFTTVAMNFLKFFCAYLCLLIAFSLSFNVLLPEYAAFKTVFISFLKIIMMMSGELEFEDIFFDNNRDNRVVKYKVTTHVMFLAFVLLVTVILTNLMVGLAVSDIQGLQQSAGLDRLVRQAELVAHLESILFSKFLKFLPKRLLATFYRHALLLKSQYQWALYIRPNDPREERIPKNIIQNIYQLVAQSKPKKKRKSTKRRNEYKVNILPQSAPMSRMNSYNSCDVSFEKNNLMAYKVQTFLQNESQP